MSISYVCVGLIEVFYCLFFHPCSGPGGQRPLPCGGPAQERCSHTPSFLFWGINWRNRTENVLPFYLWSSLVLQRLTWSCDWVNPNQHPAFLQTIVHSFLLMSVFRFGAQVVNPNHFPRGSLPVWSQQL